MRRLLAVAALAISIMQGPGHPGPADRPIAPAFQPIRAQQLSSPQPVVMLAAMTYGDGVTRAPGAPVRTGW